MENMKKMIVKYRDKELYGFNCAEAILHSANEYYNLCLDDAALKMVSGFGGGLFEGHLCGIVSGAVAVLGLLFKGQELNGESLLEITVNEYKDTFRANYDKIDCNYLKENHYDENVGCNYLIYEGADILQNVIDKYRK